jgi:hypothetical protein
MKVTLNIKLVNSRFNQVYADKENEGEETEDNIRHLWEDEFIVKGNVTDFKVKNNAVYTLAGYLPDDKQFSYDIPDMTIIECTMDNGSVSQFPISKKLILSTDKQQTEKEIMFFVKLKSSKPLINPMDGAYFLKDDYPQELLPHLKDEDEEE